MNLKKTNKQTHIYISISYTHTLKAIDNPNMSDYQGQKFSQWPRTSTLPVNGKN